MCSIFKGNVITVFNELVNCDNIVYVIVFVLSYV